MPRNLEFSIPEGTAFLELAQAHEDRCAADTEARIVDLGQKAPRCYEQTGTVLALVNGMASCFWGCEGGSHDVERLCGRVVSDARAAIRLMKAGLYDQTLMLCRSMGEFAAMLMLFSQQRGALTEWRTLSESQRRKRFMPAKVRQALEDLGAPMPNEPERYRTLSAKIVHPHPSTAPQSYNILSIPTLGGVLQRDGVVLCINEIAYPLALAAVGGARLLNLDTAIRQRVINAAVTLVRSLGSVQYAEWETLRLESQIEAFGVEVRGPRDLPREP